ncbi:MAG: hypothetical protein EXR63_01645 [Dehalococcoidia bacterium]|nr:hypothetical protein [Dehalococcoidia bacterium]
MTACVGTTLALLLVALAALGLGVRPAAAQTAGLTEDVLRNTTYPSEFSPTPRSRCETVATSGTNRRRSVATVFAQAVIGPEFAAVLIDSSTGGSGLFLSLHSVASVAGAVTAGPGLFLGDRQRVEAFTIEGGRVRVTLLTQGPTDPFCCPTQRETREFVREGNASRLVSTVITRLGSGPLTPPPPRTGNLGLADDARGPGATASALVLATIALALVVRRRTAAH